MTRVDHTRFWWQYPTTKQVVAPLMPQMVACFKALLAPPC
jgi:hypothetical protein